MANLKELKLNIEGMHCEGCANRIERAIKNISGVKKVKVNFEKKEAEISLSKDCQKEILDLIEDLGYSASIKE